MSEKRYDWCPVCGDAKACFHRPDEIVVQAWTRETYRNAKEER